MNVHLWSFLESSRDPLVALCPDFCCFLYFRICNSKSILKGRTFFLWQPQEGKFSNKWMMAVPEVIQTYNSILSWWWINFTYLFKPMMKIQIKKPKNPNCFKILPKNQSLEDSIFQMQNFMAFPVTRHFIRPYLFIICRCYPRGCCLNSKKIRIDEPKMEPSQSQKYCY